MGIDLWQVAGGLLVLLCSLTVHEAAHAWTADRLGDPTARQLGRVSFNPVRHIDPIGTLVFPVIAMLTAFPLIGWAKPVPVNLRNLGTAWKQKHMLIAAAGPLSNLALAIGVAVVLRGIGSDHPAERLLNLAVYVNVLLAVFNLIPLPPLDGGNVLAGLLRGTPAQVFEHLRPYGFLILYGLMFSGILAAWILPPALSIYGWLV